MVPLNSSPVGMSNQALLKKSILLSSHATGISTPTAMTVPGTAYPRLAIPTAPSSKRELKTRLV